MHYVCAPPNIMLHKISSKQHITIVAKTKIRRVVSLFEFWTLSATAMTVIAPSSPTLSVEEARRSTKKAVAEMKRQTGKT